MYRPIVVLAVLAYFVCESSCQRFIRLTYRPPPKRPVIIRAKRANDQPLWLYQDDVPRAPATGDHPYLPKYIDDIHLDPHRRVARSYGTPSVSRGGASPSSSKDTGATHPGYNRRNARSLPKIPGWPTLPPFNPQLPGPKRPWDTNPGRLPMYV